MSPDSLNLCCRLLCASGAAYDIDPATGIYRPPAGDPHVATAGFTGTPTAIAGGPDRVNACLVGETADGVIVAFRGTLTFSLHSEESLIDWLEDLMAEPEARPGLPGLVHTGFLDATASIIVQIAAEVKRRNPDGSKKTWVTGHSLGGAMAALGAWILHAPPHGIAIEQTVTFAAPKPGDSVFKSAYEKTFANHVRYENHNDIVPLVPPAKRLIDAVAHIPLLGDLFRPAESWDYQPVGELRYIESAADGCAITGDHVMLDEERFVEVAAELTDDMVRRNFASITANHSIACGHGYMTGTCPVAVCAGKVVTV